MGVYTSSVGPTTSTHFCQIILFYFFNSISEIEYSKKIPKKIPRFLFDIKGTWKKVQLGPESGPEREIWEPSSGLGPGPKREAGGGGLRLFSRPGTGPKRGIW